MDPHEISGIHLDGLDWAYIFQKSQLHRTAPLLYNNLKKFSVPVHKVLRAMYSRTAFCNMLYLEELKHIQEEFKRHGMRMVVLKGPVLARGVYGNIALRPFGDVDILVRGSDLSKIGPLLNSLGYSCEDPELYERYHYHSPFTKKGKINFLFELHWEFVDRFILNRVDMDKVWQVAGGEILPPEINVLYLLLHIHKHAFLNKIVYSEPNPGDWIFVNPRGNRLIWYTDLYELISGCEIDWENVVELSKEWAIEHIVYCNLYVLNQLYPLHQVEHVLGKMPRYRLGSLKRFTYIPVLRKKNGFDFDPAMHLRPARLLDVGDYLFPSPRVLMNHYRIRKKSLAVYYFFHFFAGLKEILNEFLGLCEKKLKKP